VYSFLITVGAEGASAIVDRRLFAAATRSASRSTIDHGSTSGIAVFFCRNASKSRSNTVANQLSLSRLRTPSRDIMTMASPIGGTALVCQTDESQ
jgi:hypothetical protein